MSWRGLFPRQSPRGASDLILAKEGSAHASANPASVFCGRMGGQSQSAKLQNGDELGPCTLPGNKIVEEWTLFRMFTGEVPAQSRNPFAANE
ncbi:DUF333 domain-containing protein [Rhizobium leguminosarum]